MSAPELDRLLSKGYYGTAVNQFVSIVTKGWYDIFEPFVPVAVTASFIVKNDRSGSLSVSGDRKTALSVKNDRRGTLTRR